MESSGTLFRRISVTAAVLEKDGMILIARRKRGDRLADKWEFPGGKIEPGESAHTAVVRELDEELDILADPDVVFHTQEWIYGDASYKVTYFIVRHYTGSPINNAFECFRWVTPLELLGMDILEGNREAIEKLVALPVHDYPA